MNRYKIDLGAKSYIALGFTAYEAVERLCNRRLPDGGTWWMYKGVKMYDADTRGEDWAQCKIERCESGDYEIVISSRIHEV